VSDTAAAKRVQAHIVHPLKVTVALGPLSLVPICRTRLMTSDAVCVSVCVSMNAPVHLSKALTSIYETWYACDDT
jgi:hypothetical protein